jgi:hypothetical protein
MGARRAMCTAARGWPGGVVGAAPPVRTWHVAQGERAGKAVQHGRSHGARTSGR